MGGFVWPIAAMSSGPIILLIQALLVLLVDKLDPFILLDKVFVSLPKECFFSASLEARAFEKNAKVSIVILWAKLLRYFTQQLHLIRGQTLIVLILGYG